MKDTITMYRQSNGEDYAKTRFQNMVKIFKK